MYVILHAFSRRNSGDGLLVDLTFEALKAAGIERGECTLLALDPESFPEVPNVRRAPGEPAARPSGKLALAGVELAADLIGGGRVRRLVGQARGVIAVGGGYLVADSATRQLGVMLNHLVQLRAAARGPAPSIYLPQSIGPLEGPVGRATAATLRGIDRLYLRDDRSMAELALPNARRCADLAVMKLARALPAGSGPIGAGSPTALVARALPRPGDYEQRLRELGRQVAAPTWPVQADTGGGRSDAAFYDLIGVPSAGPFAEVLERSPPGVVISVRLHGALAALLAGAPAIHLAYERKGWGAYEDLGLADYVHDARRFDPGVVAAQAEQLRREPERLWEPIRKAAPRLREQYEELVSDLRSRLRG
jgi:polysaccharide pyruvyl transferase WcaK-like protein